MSTPDTAREARQKGEWLSRDPLWKTVRDFCANCEHPKGSRGACPDCVYWFATRTRHAALGEAARIAGSFCSSSKEPCNAVEQCQPEMIAIAIRQAKEAL